MSQALLPNPAVISKAVVPMNFKVISEHKLKVILTKEELLRFDLTYEDLDYQAEHTKKLLSDILLRARSLSGFDPTDAKLFIEVYPDSLGGCVFYFTALPDTPPDDLNEKVVPRPAVFFFEELDVLIEACTKLFRLYCHRIYKSSVYRMGKGYRLVVYPLDNADSVTVAFLQEYGRLLGEGPLQAAYTEEHGKPIIEGNAIDTISAFLA